MPLPDLLPIQPFTRPACGDVVLPGSKSLTNRALLLAALCAKPVTLEGALFSEDTEIMAEALRQLGFAVEESGAERTIRVSGRGGMIPAQSASLHVGLAGTAARFLSALCASAKTGVFKIDGVPQMRKRPMKGLFDALERLGAKVVYCGEAGHFPVEIHAQGLRGGDVAIDASESSQMLSALLMVAPLAAAPLRIKLLTPVRWPFVQMTINQMAQFGFFAPVTRDGDVINVPNGSYDAASCYAVEPDATAASYYSALPLVVGGNVRIPAYSGLSGGLQGDTQFLRVVQQCGGSVKSSSNGTEISVGAGQRRAGITQDFREFSDTFLTLAAIAPLFDGPTKISGIAHTRKQETDRVAGMVSELRRLGQQVLETEDSIEIHPRPLIPGVAIETYGDHRFAMSFAILGCYDLLGNGRSWLSIKNPACCTKTFPNFFDVLAALWEKSHSLS
jgi:3-phosphoshikimate 1-carboxyvinyltransferase